MSRGAGPVAPNFGSSDAPNSVSAGRQGTEASVLDGGKGATQAPTGYAPKNMPAAERPTGGRLPAGLDRTGPDQSDFGNPPSTMDVTHNPVRHITPPSGA